MGVVEIDTKKVLLTFILLQLLLVAGVSAEPLNLLPSLQRADFDKGDLPLSDITIVDHTGLKPGEEFKSSFENSGPFAIELFMGEENSPHLKDLGGEAYSISIDKSGGKITAASERALFYALLTFKDLTDGGALPLVEIVDHPDYPVRGIIEGFYDTPWSHLERLSMIEFLGQNKMNTYVYAPKDDPYHREKWREPYPEDQLLKLKELAKCSFDNYVDFVFAISPGITIEFSKEADWESLIEKTEAMLSIGITRFALLLDDIDPYLKSAKDRAKYNNNPALAQVDLCNRYQEYLKERVPGHRLIVVPTEYYQEGTSPYRETFKRGLLSEIIIYSTGYGIVAETISEKEAGEIADIWGREIVYWDNYPVNDYNRTKLFMSPLAGRDPRLPGTLGFTFNPMNEAELSKLPLSTCADYTWNSAGYNPLHSFEKAVLKLGGDDPGTYRRFAEQNHTFFKDGPKVEYPALKDLTDQFFEAYNDYLSFFPEKINSAPESEPALSNAKETALEKAELLKTEFSALANIREDFTESFPIAAKEAEPYLRRLEFYGKAGAYYADMASQLVEAGPILSCTGEDPEKNHFFDLALELYLKGLAINRFGSLSEYQIGSSGTLIPVLEDLARLFTGLFSPRKFIVKTNMPSWQDYLPPLAADGDSKTLFWSSRGQREGDYLLVDLGKAETFDTLLLLMGNNNNDYFQSCKVEISLDGKDFHLIDRFQNTPEIRKTYPEKMEARYLKLTGLADGEYWVMIREFSPILEDSFTLDYSGTLTDVVNKVAVDPFFVYENEITLTFLRPTKLKLAAILQDPSTKESWGIAYSFDGDLYSEPVFKDHLVQTLPPPGDPVKAIRFIPKEPGSYIRGLIVLPDE